ncbi:MAG: hypothetical protein RMJ98_16900 [Myxococcales bacterium]|nr:hypothetical protein [Polyangiaceae bacterium]MDW8250975.1 hypothetical protein [Myxococcales bacterium]
MQPPYQLELGPDVAYVQRLSASPTRGVSSRSALAPGLLGRATLLSWLTVGFRYNRSFHTIDLSSGALGTSAPKLQAASDLQVTTLQGALQPTWQVRPSLRLYASLGMGWGSVMAPAIRLQGATPSTIRQRRGVFVEAPLGLGITWWILPRWLSVTYEASYATAFGSSGDAYTPDTYVNLAGQNATASPMPSFLGSGYHHFTVALTI